MASVIMVNVTSMASVTYGKCNYGKRISANAFMAKVLWQM